METTKNNNTNNWPFNKKNYLLFGIGIIVIILGYVIMATGEVNSFQSVKLAPVLLVIWYLVIIPLSIFYKDYYLGW